jgi:AGCS family alanine or glycine:cation symporter
MGERYCLGATHAVLHFRTGTEFVWLLSDTLNVMMAIPNLIALAALSPIVFKLTQEFFDTRGKSEKNPF